MKSDRDGDKMGTTMEKKIAKHEMELVVIVLSPVYLKFLTDPV
jgi:hypothetical protein